MFLCFEKHFIIKLPAQVLLLSVFPFLFPPWTETPEGRTIGYLSHKTKMLPRAYNIADGPYNC